MVNNLYNYYILNLVIKYLQTVSFIYNMLRNYKVRSKNYKNQMDTNLNLVNTDSKINGKNSIKNKIKCFICDSEEHLAKKYSQKKKKEEKVKNYSIH